jgi:penicillin-binding protein 1A
MQQYAEEAVREHIGKEIQPAFNRQKRGRKFAPFTFPNMTDNQREIEVNQILGRAMRQSDRYRGMKNAGASEEEIKKAFNTKTEMSVYSWNDVIDTVLTPLDSIRYLKSFLRSGFMAMDAHTGHVKAYVGGIDYANFQYDMVTTGRRQIGSTMKPFVYSFAMIEGFTPCNTMLHVQQTYYDENGTPWIPKNASTARIGEMVTVQWGLQNSSNWVTAYLMSYLSPYALERLLRSYGFKGYIEPVISMCLGTPDVSVAEMVSAYSVFTNKGIRLDPMYVTHIEDSYGNIVGSFSIQPHEVLNEDATFKMLNML